MFKDNLGREVFIEGFDFDPKTGRTTVFSRITLKKDQSTMFAIDKAAKGIIGKDISNREQLPKNEASNGTLELIQENDKLIFAVTNGFVILGISFDIDILDSEKFSPRAMFKFPSIIGLKLSGAN